MAADNKGARIRLLFMLTLTVSFFFVELIVGYVTNSMALVADSFHMLSDVIALIIAYISVRISPKGWIKNTFGWARAEVLGALVNAVFLIALCFSIFVESIKRFYSPEELHSPDLILGVGVAGLVVNIIGLFLFHGAGGHSHSANGGNNKTLDQSIGDELVKSETKEKPGSAVKSSEQMNMRGVFLHILADALGSVIVCVSALIMMFTDWPYKEYIDPTLSILMVCLIMYSTWPLLVESAMILLQTVPTHIQINALRDELIQEIKGVLAVHEFHVWQLAGDRIIASAHIRCQNLEDYMKIAEKVKEFFHNKGIHSTTIQPEFVDLQPKNQAQEDLENCMFDCPPNIVCAAQTCCGIKNGTQKQPSSIMNDGLKKAHTRAPIQNQLKTDKALGFDDVRRLSEVSVTIPDAEDMLDSDVEDVGPESKLSTSRTHLDNDV